MSYAGGSLPVCIIRQESVQRVTSEEHVLYDALNKVPASFVRPPKRQSSVFKSFLIGL